MAFLHKEKIIKTVSFLGFGKSNRAVFEYLKKHYPDIKFTLRLIGRSENLPAGVKIFENGEVFNKLSEDIVFVSPSIRRDKKELKGKLLSSDAELFFEKNVREIFAVTGSDGKSTTTSLAAKLLNTQAIGNIGVPFTKALDYKEEKVFAAELSSFQLMNFAPKTRRAIITNITKNHLDWHSSYEEYINAKENILKNTEEPVFLLDTPKTFELLNKYKPYAIASANLSKNEIKKHEAQTYVYIKDGFICANGDELISVSDLLRREKYNVKNFLSAIALTHGFFNKKELIEIGKNFSGLSHRFEFSLEVSKVKFFNSSIDSSPERTLSTLSSITFPYVLILGGRTKMSNFEILRETIAKNAHALVLTGENRYEIYEKLKSFSKEICIESDFDSAVKKGFLLTKNNCALVFSPASVSYDAFSNFEERGEAFKRVAQEIKMTYFNGKV